MVSGRRSRYADPLTVPPIWTAMTVAELIELLKTYPPDIEVWLDGGDWAGEVNSACVEDFSSGKHLMLSNDED